MNRGRQSLPLFVVIKSSIIPNHRLLLSLFIAFLPMMTSSWTEPTVSVGSDWKHAMGIFDFEASEIKMEYPFLIGYYRFFHPEPKVKIELDDIK